MSTGRLRKVASSVLTARQKSAGTPGPRAAAPAAMHMAPHPVLLLNTRRLAGGGAGARARAGPPIADSARSGPAPGALGPSRWRTRPPLAAAAGHRYRYRPRALPPSGTCPRPGGNTNARADWLPGHKSNAVPCALCPRRPHKIRRAPARWSRAS